MTSQYVIIVFCRFIAVQLGQAIKCYMPSPVESKGGGAIRFFLISVKWRNICQYLKHFELKIVNDRSSLLIFQMSKRSDFMYALEVLL